MGGPDFRHDSTALIERVHAIGRDVVAGAADSVDRDARFPAESIEALKAARLLGAYVPVDYGGLGLGIDGLSAICEVLGQYCATSAMVYAMHQIQVGCIVHHALGSAYFRDFATELAERQLLLASATTELGIGGDLRSSLCAVKVEGERFMLEKQAPVISYGAYADGILVTCRESEQAAKSDQVMVLARKEHTALKQLGPWDTLGFRGTCSNGFALTTTGTRDQILPVPYAQIHAKTMHPFAHIVWASLWLGLATDALNRARGVVRTEARKNPGVIPINATRLAEADIVLFQMRSVVRETVAEYQRLLVEDCTESFSSYGFGIRINNLKLTCSQLVVDVVSRAMLICGIAGYRNDSKASLGRHLRDAYGAQVMVNNDRILGHNATMHIAQREA